MTVKILLIDNYDSFTYNIAHYLGILGYPVEVIQHDDCILKRLDQLDFTHIILSPGPGSPAESGLTFEVIDRMYKKLPILGICLGHQCLGAFFGAQVVHANEVMHGKKSLMHHDGSRLFRGLPQIFNVVRYHSLILDPESLPTCLKVTAWSHGVQEKTIEVMAIQHRHYKIFGVQYHPEAILTEYGLDVLKNFILA
jgi:anthranilate synthase/aminodeoxychorismate synthase-like glutamine amidotransferase